MNVFFKINWLADFDKQVKYRKARNRNWYDNIYKFLPDEQVLTFNGALRGKSAIKRTAAGVFQSRWNRKTRLRLLDDKPVQFEPAYGSDVERDAIVSLIETALDNFERNKITSTQTQTLVLERQAKEIGVPAIDTHIAETLNISRRAAQMRLRTARKAKTFVSDKVIDIIDIEKNVRKELSRTCAWCGESTRDGLRTFCDTHHKQFLVDGNFEDVLVTDDEFWRLKNKADADHWQTAIDWLRENAA